LHTAFAPFALNHVYVDWRNRVVFPLPPRLERTHSPKAFKVQEVQKAVLYLSVLVART